MIRVKVEGLEAIKAKLSDLTKRASSKAQGAALEAVGNEIVKRARALAPVEYGDLRESIRVEKKLSKRQTKIMAARFRIPKSYKKGRGRPRATFSVAKRDTVYRYAGPSDYNSASRRAHLSEFGAPNNVPTPFMRPAWDEVRERAVEIYKKTIAKDILG